MRWIQIYGTDLIDAISDSTLGDLIPKSAGIYLWRRRLQIDPSILSDSDVIGAWLEAECRKPMAILSEKRINYSATWLGMRIGGGQLTSDKKGALIKAASSGRKREHLSSFIASLNAYTPPLYVGESNNLAKRVKDHLSGETRLEAYVRGKLGLRWQDLELNYLKLTDASELSDNVKSYQQLLEYIAQTILSPFGTERPG